MGRYLFALVLFLAAMASQRAPNSRSPSHVNGRIRKVRHQGPLLTSVSAIFRLLAALLPSHRIATRIRNTGTERRRDIFLDIYITLMAGVVISLVVLMAVDNPWLRGVAVSIAIFRILEILVTQSNTALFDELRGHPPLSTVQRIVLIAFVNLAQVVVCYAVLISYWLPQSALAIPAGTPVQLADIPTAVWTSFKIATLVEVPSGLTGYQWLLPVSEIITTTWLFVVILAWAVSGLPARASR